MRRWFALLGASLLSGCSSGVPPAPAASVHAAVARDAAALFLGRPLALLLLGVLAALAAAALGRVLFELARRFGLDRERRWARLPETASALIAVLTLASVFDAAVNAAPLLTALLVLFAAPALLFALAPLLRSAAAAVIVAFDGRVRPGDRVTLGGFEGTVRRIGLFQLVLTRSDGGGSLRLPTRLLLEEPVTIAARDHGYTVRVVVEGEEAPTQAQLHKLERALLALPLRVAGADSVRLRREGERLIVEVDAASERVVSTLERQLRAAVRRARE